ncbi:MAG: hypothetical protein V3576_05830 [Candidatus Cloacimonadota bacterium]
MVKLSLVRIPILLLLLCIPLPFLCQEVTTLDEDWEEFSEQTQYQSADDLQTSFANLLLDSWTRDMEQQQLRISYQPESLRYHAWLRHKAWKLAFSGVNQDGETWQSVSLAAETIGTNSLDFHLMSYRASFGRGLVVAQGSPGKALEFSTAGDAGTYYPLGFALSGQIYNLDIGLFYSSQKRYYNYTPYTAIKLPRTKAVSLYSTDEALGGFSLAYLSKSFTAGALTYLQAYQEETGIPLVSSLSFTTSWKDPNHRIELESAFAERGYAHKGQWRYSRAGISSELGFSHSRDYTRPAYAAPIHKLRSTGSATEFWETLQFPLSTRMKLKLQAIALKDNSQLTSSKYLSQYLAKLSWADSLSQASFGIRQLQREILSYEDNSYISTRPHHLRFESSFRRQLNPDLEASLLLRYHLEELSKYENNSHYWRISFAYDPAPWRLEASLLSWQTVRELYIWDQDIDNNSFHPGFSSRDDLLLLLGCGWVHRSVTLTFRAKSSLLHGRLEELNFFISI